MMMRSTLAPLEGPAAYETSSSVEPEIRHLLDLTGAELNRQSREATGHPLTQLHLVEVKKRDFSLVLILLAETAVRRQKLVLKKVVHHPVNLEVTKSSNQAVVEFKILEQLHHQFEPVKGCAVPYPVAVFPDEEAFVMEYVEGDLLSKQLDAARYWGLPQRFKELEASYYSLGQWLKHFQTVIGIEYCGAEICESLLERCESRLQMLADCPLLRCSKTFVSKTLEYLRKQVLLVPDKVIPIAGRHGDFGDWNVLVNESGVTVFDFLGYLREPIAYDLLKMLTRLQSLKCNPLYSHTRIDRLQEQFLAGYGVMPPTPVPVLSVCEVYHKICMIGGCIANRSVRPDYAIWNRRLLLQGVEFVGQLEQVVSGDAAYVPSFMAALNGRPSRVRDIFS